MFTTYVLGGEEVGEEMGGRREAGGGKRLGKRAKGQLQAREWGQQVKVEPAVR